MMLSTLLGLITNFKKFTCVRVDFHKNTLVLDGEDKGYAVD